MTVTVTKSKFNLRDTLNSLKKQTGLVGEQIMRAETASDFYNVVGQNRNRIINGAMVIDQRNAGASVINISNNLFTVDRWITNLAAEYSSVSCVTSQQNLDALTPPANFKNYIGVKMTTGVAAPASPFLSLRQLVEGYNIADLGYGTSSAQTVTCSFWARSNLAGTYAFSLRGGSPTRSYVTNFTINSANNWEFKTFVVPGDSDTGTVWESTNSVGFGVNIGLNSFQGVFATSTLNQWTTGSFTGSTTQNNNFSTTTGNAFYITGVQLEKGTVATPFEHRLFGAELALCQRYFQIVGGTGGTEHFANGVTTTDRINIIYNFKQTMRASPSFTATSFGSAFSNLNIYNGITTLAVTGSNENYMSANSASIGFTHGGSTTAGGAGYIYFNSAAARVAFSAEF